jgi:short-subunit dehydrogenase
MESFRDDVLNAHGRVNILINNAGITLQKNFSTHSLKDWDRIMGVNLWGVIYGCHFFDEALTDADEAHVINLSSMSAFLGLPGQSSYCATKAGVQLLTDSLWAEWSLKGIGLTSVQPGAIRTDMIMATLEESDDIEQAKKNYAIAHKTGVDAEYAAVKIIRAIEKEKMRLRIGKDSFIFHYISRFMPGLGRFATKKIAAKLAG